MPTIDEYKKKGGWYEFPNGEKRQGEEAAQAYLDSVDVDELFENEPEAEEETAQDNVITTDDLPDDEEPDVEETADEPEGEDTAVEAPAEDTDAEGAGEFLVRRTIAGVKFQVKGPSGKRYTFTREHPLVVVREEDVEFFVTQDQFELATPQQAKEFYS